MRALLLSGVAVGALVTATSVATAQSGPRPVFNWSGFYAGVNVGAADGGSRLRIGDDYSGNFSRFGGFLAAFDSCDGGCPVTFLDGITESRSGTAGWDFTGGARFGVNGQWGGFVAGLEADVNWVGRGSQRASLDTGKFFFGESLAPAGTSECEDGQECILYDGVVNLRAGRSNWVSTVRGRFGFAWDRVLVYGTGGLAFQGAGSSRSTTTLTRTDFDVLPTGVQDMSTVSYATRFSRNQVGWAAGVGVEWAFLDNMSVGLEYLRADFGSYGIRFVDPVLTAAGDTRPNASDAPTPQAEERRIRVRDYVDFVRLNVNFRF